MAEQFAHLSYGAVTDVGSRRKNNEDSILTLPEHGVFCVADGMGGVQGGEVASQAAVTFLSKAFDKLEGPEAAASVVAKAQVIDRALNAASRWIKQRSDKKGIKGCGTTAVAIAFDGRNPRHAIILHAGDSRAYRLRGERLEQLSKDHTVAAAAGLEDDSELPAMFRGVVTRAVGVKARVEVEKTPVDVVPGDVYLLASDGLDKMVTDPEIQARMEAHQQGDLQALAQTLVDDANRNGGVDNVSVIAVRADTCAPDAVTAGDDAVAREIKTYLAEDERRRDLGIVDDLDDDERHTGEGDTPHSGPLEGVTPSGGAVEDESDTDDRALPEPGPLAGWWRKWLQIPLGLRYAFAFAVLIFLALVIAQALRGRRDAPDARDRRGREAPLAEAQQEIEAQAPVIRGPRTVPVLLPEPEPEPAVELTPEERQAQIDRMLQDLDALAPPEPTASEPEPEPGPAAPPEEGAAAEAPAAGPAEPEPEPVDLVEQARLEQARQQRERAAREARSPARLAEVRAALPGRIDQALETGQWGALSEYVDTWEPHIDGLVAGSGQALVYRGWLEVWRNARDASGEAEARLAAYEDQMQQVFEACGFEAPAREEAGAEGSAEDRASRYCARRHALQIALASQVRGFAVRHAAQSALLPDDPAQAFRNLWLFTGQTRTAGADEAARRLAEGRAELDRLKTWLAVRTDEPFTVEELGLVPLGSVPVVREQFDQVWSSLYASAALIAPQLSVWRNWEDDTLAEQLDTLADLQKEVVLSREPYGDDVAAWRASGSHEALSRLLVQVDKVYPLLRRKIDAAKR